MRVTRSHYRVRRCRVCYPGPRKLPTRTQAGAVGQLPSRKSRVNTRPRGTIMLSITLREGAKMKQGPVAVSLFFCEQILVEELTRNITPVSCFTRRALHRFPSEPVS